MRFQVRYKLHTGSMVKTYIQRKYIKYKNDNTLETHTIITEQQAANQAPLSEFIKYVIYVKYIASLNSNPHFEDQFKNEERISFHIYWYTTNRKCC